MVEKRFAVINAKGIHARPSMQIARIADRFASEIEFELHSTRVNAKSILEVMTLAAAMGAEIIARAEGEDASDALDALERLFRNKFEEE